MEFELYHHGVKGMKWGVRKARKAYDVVLDRKRKKGKREHDRGVIDDIVKPKGDPNSRDKEKREARREQKTKDAKLAWRQAKNKAKMDPKYKDSDEYRKAKMENAIAVSWDALHELANIPTKKL